MCFQTTKWKREIINDHKFEYIDASDFTDNSAGARFSYMIVFARVVKATLVYVADVYTAVSLFVMKDYYMGKDSIYRQISGFPVHVLRFVFWASILISFGLLAWEYRKSRRVYKTRDISYAYTSPLVYRYICLVSYPHYCFFRQIDNHRKFKDNVAFFVFFNLKSWKRVLFAESPRQVFNGLALGFMLKAIYIKNHNSFPADFDAYAKETSQKFSICVMAFTFIMYAISVLTIIAAAALYVPLLFSIQGNIKEYCCHKVDKRVAMILKKYSKKRIAADRANAEREKKGLQTLYGSEGDGSAGVGEGPREPTLPKLDYDVMLDEPVGPHPAGNVYNPYGVPVQPYRTDSPGPAYPMQPRFPPAANSVYAPSVGPTSVIFTGRDDLASYADGGGGSTTLPANDPRRQLADVAYSRGRQPALPNLDYVLNQPESMGEEGSYRSYDQADRYQHHQRHQDNPYPHEYHQAGPPYPSATYPPQRSYTDHGSASVALGERGTSVPPYPHDGSDDMASNTDTTSATSQQPLASGYGRGGHDPSMTRGTSTQYYDQLHSSARNRHI
ncbi:Potassium transporter [Tieghemiomyces parasiticus]|uniref:Potassium transporter n=1 Tax=Tieghemiomyces parasiticus TaxID=78921 RepID=A0A9W8E1X1_9FUNG|nr:Potassium transporter [Tieghemiomyces parasiticus]